MHVVPPSLAPWPLDLLFSSRAKRGRRRLTIDTFVDKVSTRVTGAYPKVNSDRYADAERMTAIGPRAAARRILPRILLINFRDGAMPPRQIR